MAEYISEYISNYSVEKISALPAWKPGDDISTYSATKIGGLPAWIQGKESRSEAEIFLGQISSLCPSQKVPYPFIDCYPIYAKGSPLGFTPFYLPGGASLYLFMNSSGKINYIFQAT